MEMVTHGDPIIGCQLIAIEGLVKKTTQQPGDCNDNDAALTLKTIWYLDADSDGYGSNLYIPDPAGSCGPPNDSRHYTNVIKGYDCDESDPTNNPEAVWVFDKDGDGYYAGEPITGCQLIFIEGLVKKTTQQSGDCNDNNAAVYPGAVEIADGLDNNCNETIDEGGCVTTVITRNITAYINAGGVAIITPNQINNGSFSLCGPLNLSLDKTIFICDNIGPNIVTLTVTDANGNTTSGSAIVTIQDHTVPIVFTKNITAQIDAGGVAVIEDRDVDDGSYDPCGLVSYKLDKTTFDCSNIGLNTVTTVTDANGNTASATAIVIVEDHTLPIVITKNITAQIDAGGVAIIGDRDVDDGSYDACGLVSYRLDKKRFFCNDTGPNTVTLTVTDANGNTASATAIVTVEDHTLPIVITKNIIAHIDAGGVALVGDRDVDYGSYDPCGLVSYKLDKTIFDCSNIGPNTVTLTVTDANGNTASRTAIVTVEDHTLPKVITKNITVQLDATVV